MAIWFVSWHNAALKTSTQYLEIALGLACLHRLISPRVGVKGLTDGLLSDIAIWCSRWRNAVLPATAGGRRAYVAGGLRAFSGGGPLCTEPSTKPLPIVLEDAFKLGFSRDQKQVEHYFKLIQQRIITLSCKTRFSLIDTVQLKVWSASFRGPVRCF